jgi:hypothetical protein
MGANSSITIIRAGMCRRHSRSITALRLRGLGVRRGTMDIMGTMGIVVIMAADGSRLFLECYL